MPELEACGQMCNGERMGSESKRAAPRAPIEIKVEYKRMNSFVSDFTKDIGRDGLFVRSEEPLAVGTECYFTLEIPRLPDPITLAGVVKRVVPSGGEEEAGMGIGFKFKDEQERSALATVVDNLMVEHLGEALFNRLASLRKRPGAAR